MLKKKYYYLSNEIKRLKFPIHRLKRFYWLQKQNQLVIHVEVLIKLRCAKNLISSSKKRIYNVSSYIVNSANFIIIHRFLSRLLHFFGICLNWQAAHHAIS